MATSRTSTRKTARSNLGRRVRDAFETAQETMQSRVGGAREQAQETWVNLEALFQSRVQRAMHQLGVPTGEEVRILTRRVSELNENVRAMNIFDNSPSCLACRSIPSTKSLSRNTPTSPGSEKSVSVVKNVAALTDVSPRFFITPSASDSVVPAMQ